MEDQQDDQGETHGAMNTEQHLGKRFIHRPDRPHLNIQNTQMGAR